MGATDIRRLGRTGLEITRLGFGGHPLGNIPSVFPDPALETVAAAHQSGIRLFDTAPNYGRGLSEHRLGHVLRALPRESFVLSSKVGKVLIPDREASETPPGSPMRGVTDYSRDATLRSIEASLHRLGVANLDIVLIHDVDLRAHKTMDVYRMRFREAMDGAYRALTELREQKVIGAIGIGVNEVQPCIDFAHAGDFDCFMLAGRYTLLDHAEALGSLLPLCEKRGISVLMAGPYNSGILATGARQGARYFYADAPPEILGRTSRIEEICAAFDIPLAAAALQFPLLHSAVTSVVVGAATPDEIERNVALMAVSIPDELWRALKEHALLANIAPISLGRAL